MIRPLWGQVIAFNMLSKTHNYLRAHRKRGGLTQDEMAFLLGCESGTKVSRYERLSREPNLYTVFACQAVFGIPAHELFPSIYQKVEDATKHRAHALSKKIDSHNLDAITHRKIETLHAVASQKTPEPEHPE